MMKALLKNTAISVFALYGFLILCGIIQILYIVAKGAWSWGSSFSLATELQQFRGHIVLENMITEPWINYLMLGIALVFGVWSGIAELRA